MLPDSKDRSFETDTALINMELTATALRYTYSALSILLVIILASQTVSSGQHTSLPRIGDGSQFCDGEGFPTTSLEYQLCKEYPDLILHFFDTSKLLANFNRLCHKQFKHKRWDCKNIEIPLFKATSRFLTLETKEAAFVHALASATITHTVAQWCADNDGKVEYCGCDKRWSNETLPNKKWRCSPDIHFAAEFMKKLVEARVDNATSQYQFFVLHNCKIGQLVVEENMKETCYSSCQGNKCSKDEMCEMMLPEIENVAKELKKRYEHSVPVPPDMGMFNQTNRTLIYFNNSTSYCEPNPDYDIDGIAGRECITNSSHMSSSNHCSNLCCDHGHEEFIKKVPQPCECKFVWCCKVVCETCYERQKKHRCKSKN